VWIVELFITVWSTSDIALMTTRLIATLVFEHQRISLCLKAGLDYCKLLQICAKIFVYFILLIAGKVSKSGELLITPAGFICRTLFNFTPRAKNDRAFLSFTSVFLL